MDSGQDGRGTGRVCRDVDGLEGDHSATLGVASRSEGVGKVGFDDSDEAGDEDDDLG